MHTAIGMATIEAATMSALLEVIERDAAALWWVGGRPPRPISLETGAAAGAEVFLQQLRGAAATRYSRLLDITTDVGVPTVAAISLAADGAGFACGLAAGLTVGSAIRSAIVEMCQMELSHRVIAAKRRQRGDAALNAHDLEHLKRGRAVDADNPLIQPKGPPNDWRPTGDRSAQLERHVSLGRSNPQPQLVRCVQRLPWRRLTAGSGCQRQRDNQCPGHRTTKESQVCFHPGCLHVQRVRPDESAYAAAHPNDDPTI